MLQQDVIRTCLAINETGLNTGKSGNVSVRNDDGFLISASGVAYEAMQPSDVVQMDLDGGYVGPVLPSSEWRMHMDIFRARPEAGAIVHTHSAHATAISCLREDVPAFHYMIGITGGASLRCAPYASFGTADLSDVMLKAIEDRNACLLANHGMICFAKTVDAALALAIEVETLCKQYVLARMLGDPVILEASEMEEILMRFKSYGKSPAELADDAPPAFLPPVRRDA
ncbi:MAG: class II aldolase/adducin family protein [Pseudomonadota bacterium]